MKLARYCTASFQSDSGSTTCNNIFCRPQFLPFLFIMVLCKKITGHDTITLFSHTLLFVPLVRCDYYLYLPYITSGVLTLFRTSKILLSYVCFKLSRFKSSGAITLKNFIVYLDIQILYFFHSFFKCDIRDLSSSFFISLTSKF